MAEPQIISDAYTFPRITSGSYSVRYGELLDWLHANGIEPNDVPADSTLAVEDGPDGGRIIRYTVYLTNENGSKYTDPDIAGEAAREERTVPLKVEPPEHWRPAADARAEAANG